MWGISSVHPSAARTLFHENLAQNSVGAMCLPPWSNWGIIARGQNHHRRIVGVRVLPSQLSHHLCSGESLVPDHVLLLYIPLYQNGETRIPHLGRLILSLQFSVQQRPPGSCPLTETKCTTLHTLCDLHSS